MARHNVLEVPVPVGWMANMYEQDSSNHTKDYVACSGDGIGGGSSFDDELWNSKHGSACYTAHPGEDTHSCAPIPEEYPYDVHCDWIVSRRAATSRGGVPWFSDSIIGFLATWC